MENSDVPKQARGDVRHLSGGGPAAQIGLTANIAA